MIKVPVTNQPNQSFSITIPFATANLGLQLAVFWNEIASYWQMNISDANGGPLVFGLPMVTGQDLLRQFQHLGIGSAYVIPLATTTSDKPGTSDWGSNFVLVWGP